MLQQAVRQTLATGEPYVLELEYLRPDGGTGWIEARGTGEHDETGNVALLHGTAQEISYRKHGDRAVENELLLSKTLRDLETERSRSQHLEVALARAKKTETFGMLSASIAHDFNNVLAVVAGALHLIKASVQDALLQDFAQRGLRGIDRATKLVSQLMDFARTRSAGIARIDPSNHLLECKELLAMSLGPAIQLKVEMQPCGSVDVDPAQLEVALINLLVNARDAMPHGGQVTIFTKLCDVVADRHTAAAGWVAIGVKDSGTGMSPEVLRRVKEPFFTTKGSHGGTGLGLSMVDAFARESNGYLDIDSQQNKGTVVTIHLPIAAEIPVLAQESLPEFAPAAPDDDAFILVVDDDPMVLPMVARYLTDLNYVVLEASSAVEALEIARSNKPLRLVVTDVRMRDLDGLQLAARLKVIRPMLPLLLITGDYQQDLVARENVLFKPFTQVQLAKKVLSLLAPKRVLATRIAGRIKHPAVMELYELWVALRVGAALPSPDTLGLHSRAACDNSFIAEVVNSSPFTLRRVFVGQALASRLVDHPEGLLIADDEAFARMETTYLRCMRLREPVYEYARIRLSEGETVEFERLLLPCEENDGSQHYLVGIIIFTNMPVKPTTKDL